MKNLLATVISIIASLVIVLAISKKFRISDRYEREPRKLSDWNSLDKGIDPTKDKKK
jgi:hypothetical protein